VFASFGKTLVAAGLLIAAVGAVLLLSDKIGWIGRLPGDFTFRKGNFTFYFPLATSLIVSVLLSLLFLLFRK
jgi:hypothetical protein